MTFKPTEAKIKPEAITEIKGTDADFRRLEIMLAQAECQRIADAVARRMLAEKETGHAP